MRRALTRIPVLGSLVVLGLLTAAIVGAAPAARATPAAPSLQATYGPPTEGTKVVLPEISIDGPALWASNVTTSIKSIMAWTGTDAAHHLNVMTSTDGLTYTNKHILPEVSLWRPAVLFNVSGRGEPYGTIIVAWTGTDAAHTLNVEYISVPGFTVAKKITLWGDTSFTAPSITVLNDTVYLAWAGTDASHTLNVLPIYRTSELGTKVTLWGWSSISRPDISYDRATNAFLLGWTGLNNRIYYAESPNDTAHWKMPTSAPLAEWSAWAPSMMGIAAQDLPAHWVAWTGVDALHHVNVAFTGTYPTWAGAKAVLPETAMAGPEIGYAGGAGQVLIAWTGTDTLHHLNVAVLHVSNS